MNPSISERQRDETAKPNQTELKAGVVHGKILIAFTRNGTTPVSVSWVGMSPEQGRLLASRLWDLAASADAELGPETRNGKMP